MRKIILVIFLTGFFVACNDRLEELNKPRKGAVEVPAEPLFTNGLNELFYMMNNSDVNVNVFRLYAQYWAQTTYPDESQYNMVGRRNPDNFWRRGYRDALQDLEEARRITLETWETLPISEAERDNRVAIIDITKVYTYAILVDAFGAVPFTEALNPEILQPKYDNGADVYNAIIDMLDNALAMIDEDEPGFSVDQDPVYGDSDLETSDLTKWRKFANSLKLKLAINIADVNSAKAGTMVSEALADGIFESNADNAAMPYLGAFPNTNPIHEDLVQSGRADYVIANTISNKMNSLLDPRLDVFAETTGFTYPVNEDTGAKMDSTIDFAANAILVYQSVEGTDSVVTVATPFTIEAADSLKPVRLYYGGLYGNNNTYAQRSHVGDVYHDPTLEGLILDYAEVEFLLAEAVERGFAIPGTAEEHYNAAITASMEYWGVDEDAIEAYLLNPEVAYSTAAGTWKQKIGTQHWIALYNRGFEGWSVWRRLDFTGFSAPPMLEYSDIPNRFIFPIEEATLNGTNLDQAIQMIGGSDDVQTKVFWDIN